MLVVERPLPAPGLVTSERALRVLELLEAAGGAPESALGILYRDAPKRLRSLRAGGWAYRARLGGETLWLPRSANPPGTELEYRRQAAIGWLAARLAEAGGIYAAGAASFPNRQSFPVAVLPPDKAPSKPCLAVLLDNTTPQGLATGSLWCRADALAAQRLEQCLRRA